MKKSPVHVALSLPVHRNSPASFLFHSSFLRNSSCFQRWNLFCATNNLSKNNDRRINSGPTYQKWFFSLHIEASETPWFTILYSLICFISFISLTGESLATGNEIQALTYTWLANMQNSARFFFSLTVSWNCSLNRYILKQWITFAIHLAKE